MSLGLSNQQDHSQDKDYGIIGQILTAYNSSTDAVDPIAVAAQYQQLQKPVSIQGGTEDELEALLFGNGGPLDASMDASLASTPSQVLQSLPTVASTYDQEPGLPATNEEPEPAAVSDLNISSAAPSRIDYCCGKCFQIFDSLEGKYRHMAWNPDCNKAQANIDLAYREVDGLPQETTQLPMLESTGTRSDELATSILFFKKERLVKLEQVEEIQKLDPGLQQDYMDGIPLISTRNVPHAQPLHGMNEISGTFFHEALFTTAGSMYGCLQQSVQSSLVEMQPMPLQQGFAMTASYITTFAGDQMSTETYQTWNHEFACPFQTYPTHY